MSTPAARLRPHRDTLLEQLRNFGRVKHEHTGDVAAILEHAMREQPNKAAAAVRVSQERARAIDQGIRLAVGAAPLTQRGVAGTIQRRIAHRGPAPYGLQSVPCLTIIRRVLRAMQAEQDARNQSISITTLHLHTVRTPQTSDMPAITLAST